MFSFYRPEQVSILDKRKAFGKDLNLVYWTDRQKQINPDLIEGKCYPRPQQSILDDDETVESWSKAGQYRFYYSQFYDTKTREITNDLPSKAETYGQTTSKSKKGGKRGGKGMLFLRP